LRASSIAASDAEAMPFPNEETTPPVIKMYRVIEMAAVRTGRKLP
jgi:hypothetical protein